MKRKGRVWAIILAVLFAALLAQVIWCCCKHINKVEAGGITLEDVLSENKRLTEENANLQLLLDAEDGKCHGTCEIHCPCSHTDVTTDEGEWQWTDAKTAEVCQKGTRIKKTTCTKCGELIDEVTEMKETVEHSYTDGVCTVCGYQANTSGSTTTVVTPAPAPVKCTHGSTSKEYGEWTKNVVKTETGCFTETRTVKTVCTSCKAIISQDTENRQDTEHFFKNDKCEDCGFERACKHDVTTEEYGEWTIVTVGTAQVCYKETRMVKVVCTECGKVVSEIPDTPKETTEHFFVNGQCAYCNRKDASATCKHDGGRTLKYGDWYEVKVGTESCCHADVRDVYYICNKCGANVGIATQEKTYDYYHSYAANGICTDCGYGNYTNTTPDSDWNSWTYQDNSALPNPVNDGGYNGEYGIYGDYSEIPEPIN